MAGPKREREKLRGGGGRAAEFKTSEARNAQDYKALRKWTTDKGITVKRGLDKDVRFEDMKTTIGVVDEMAQHFGVPMNELVTKATTHRAGVMAALRGDQELYWNPYYYDPAEASRIEQIMNKLTSDGLRFHPANQTQDSTAAHETMHLLTGYLYQSDAQSTWGMGAHRIEEDIAHTALREVNENRRAAGQEPMVMFEARASITSEKGYSVRDGYGRPTSFSEVIAEAAADVYANRKKAAPYSQAIWREVERRYGVKKSYLGGKP